MVPQTPSELEKVMIDAWIMGQLPEFVRKFGDAKERNITIANNVTGAKKIEKRVCKPYFAGKITGRAEERLNSFFEDFFEDSPKISIKNFKHNISINDVGAICEQLTSVARSGHLSESCAKAGMKKDEMSSENTGAERLSVLESTVDVSPAQRELLEGLMITGSVMAKIHREKNKFGGPGAKIGAKSKISSAKKIFMSWDFGKSEGAKPDDSGVLKSRTIINNDIKKSKQLKWDF